MRKIAFRAWDAKESRLYTIVEDMSFWFEGKENAICAKVTDMGDHFIMPEHLVLMQFTGLKDKNGREIYEGDILLDDAEGEEYDFVEWDEKLGGWSTGQWFTPKDLVEYASMHEVAGNVYENPELLSQNIDSAVNAPSADSKVG